MNFNGIEGITVCEGSQDLNRFRGNLDLPPGFDSRKFACKWAKKGAGVERARNKQHIKGTNCEAAGWEVYKHKGAAWQRVIGSSVYILMVRSAVMQQAIQAMCGNVSKKRMLQEANGETVQTSPNEDYGMLSNKTLEKAGLREPETEPLAVEFNSGNSPSGAVAARASTRATIIKKQR